MERGFVKRMELKLDQYKMYIDGQFVESSEGTLGDNINPSTGEVLNQVPQASLEDLESGAEGSSTGTEVLETCPIQ